MFNFPSVNPFYRATRNHRFALLQTPGIVTTGIREASGGLAPRAPSRI
jgi:hypothetical protein